MKVSSDMVSPMSGSRRKGREDRAHHTQRTFSAKQKGAARRVTLPSDFWWVDEAR
jgi:hypothetical protein